MSTDTKRVTLTAVDTLARYAEIQPDKPALIDDTPGQPVSIVTYAELSREANRIANALLRSGVAPGQRTAWMGRNSIEAIEFIQGAARVGAPAVPLNHRMQRSDAAQLLRFSGAVLVWTDAEFAPLFADIEAETGVQQVVVFNGPPGPGQVGSAQFLAGSPDTFPPPPPAGATSQAASSFTSGTTGAPKRIIRSTMAGTSEANLQTRVWGTEPHVFITSGTISSGASGGFYALALSRGDTVVLQRKFDPEDYLRLVEKYRVSFAYLAPTVARQLAALPEEVKARYDRSSLRTVFGGASKWSYAVKLAFRETFPDTDLWEIYGSSELGSNTVMDPEGHWGRPESCGRPVEGVEIQLRDESGEPVVLPYHQGVLWVRSDFASGFEGYEGDPIATSASIDGEWRSVGDIAYFDQDGYYYISDRAKDMIVSGGINVYPAEVEAVIDSFPGVMECCVIGVPDDTWGERVHAVVVAKPGADLSASEILAHCRAHLASHKIPRDIDFVGELPHTLSGKILKREVRARYWEGAGRQI